MHLAGVRLDHRPDSTKELVRGRSWVEGRGKTNENVRTKMFKCFSCPYVFMVPPGLDQGAGAWGEERGGQREGAGCLDVEGGSGGQGAGALGEERWVEGKGRAQAVLT